MLYNLVCLDVDGTLLGNDHQIPQGNVKAIHALRKMPEVKIVLCSARPPRAMTEIYKALDLVHPVICMNGSLIMEGPLPFQKLNELKVPPVLLPDFQEIIQNLDVRLAYYDESQFYAHEPDVWIEKEANITQVTVSYLSTSNMNNLWQSKGGPHKIQAIGPQEHIGQLVEKLNRRNYEEVTYTLSHETYLEIVHRKASKKSAVQYLQEMWGLHLDQILAMGDNFNDLELLKYVGRGVAMANAPQEVQDAAKEVTLSNNQEGVKSTLEKYFQLGV